MAAQTEVLRPCADGCGDPAVGTFGLYCTRCGSGRRGKKPKYVHTDATDALIREAWAKGHGTGAAQFVSHKLKWPIWVAKRRAVVIGAARKNPREPAWTAAEAEVVEKFSWMGLDRIRLKLLSLCGTRRTRTAIHLKRKRMKIRASNIDGYSATRLSELFGVDARKVSTWIKFGWLHAERRGTERTEAQGGDTFYISQHAVYHFVLEHPEEIDLGRVERLWFLDLITKGKIGKRDEDEK